MTKQPAHTSNKNNETTKRPGSKTKHTDTLALTQDFVMGGDLSAESVLAAQRMFGNQAVMRMIDSDQPMLRFGSRNASVEQLQNLLNEKMDAGLAADGIFGTKTYQAVMAFQSDNDLAADGIVGPLTWGELLEGGGAENPPQPIPPDETNSDDAELVASLQSLKTILVGFEMNAGSASGSAGASGAESAPDGGNEIEQQALGFVQSIIGTPESVTASDQDNAPAADTVVLNATSDGKPKKTAQDLHKEISEQVKKLPGTVQATLNPLLTALDTALKNKKNPPAGSKNLATQVQQAITALLKKANETNIPSLGAGNTTFDIGNETWTIKASDHAGVSSELENRMKSHGEVAHVEELGSYAGMEINLNLKGANPNETVKNPQITVKLKRVLPEWPNANSVKHNGTRCTCWTKEWNRCHSAIVAHEEQHVAIYKLFYTNLHSKIVGKTEAQAYAIIDKTIDAQNAAQESFDDATGHGVNASPTTKFKPVGCTSC